ncbi:MAG: hypothetical protein R3F43_09015 [bacterium]
MATRMFDAALPVDGPVSPPARARFRQLVRVGSSLLHDVGHPPASHSGEAAMPPRHTLGLSLFSEAEQAERVTHETSPCGSCWTPTCGGSWTQSSGTG